MKKLPVFALVALLAFCLSSCRYGRPYSRPAAQRDATVASQEQERVEELERTEKTMTGEWHEKAP